MYKLIVLINFLSFLKLSHFETVHFTNSPNKILKANNFTTYKVESPNGDPITIIEANTPLINQNLKFNEVENTKYSINRNHDNKKHVMDLKTSLSMTVTPHNYNSNKNEFENSAVGEEESVTNDYGNLSPEHIQHRHTMKTVYSPELLQKFMQDYANKVHASNSEQMASSNQVDKVNYEEDKYKDEIIEAEDDDDTNRRVSSASNDDNGQEQPNDIHERNNYHGRPNSNHYNHPYNKNSGWVTLEAVPWSKSKVSKWQSSITKYPSQSNYNYNINSRPPPPRPSSSNYNYEEDYNGNNDDEYYNNRPAAPAIRPTYQNNQFYGGNSESHTNRPQPPDHWYQSQSHNSAAHQSSFNHHDNYDRPSRPFQPERPHQSERPFQFERPYQSERPYQPDIITDNRPSNFPSHHHNPTSNNPPNDYQRPSHNRPQSHNDYHYSGNNYNNNRYSHKDGPHPLTYPNSGSDGEWVLVSTTKGYQLPNRNGQRAMLFQAQNGVKSDSNKGDVGIITAAESQTYETSVSIRPPTPAGPTKITQQQIKLTILPHKKHDYGSNQKPSMNVGIYKPSPYDGIIETEPSTQTIEESVALASSANDANSITPKQPKKKRKLMKNYAVMRKNPGSDSTAMIAAVN